MELLLQPYGDFRIFALHFEWRQTQEIVLNMQKQLNCCKWMNGMNAWINEWRNEWMKEYKIESTNVLWGAKFLNVFEYQHTICIFCCIWCTTDTWHNFIDELETSKLNICWLYQQFFLCVFCRLNQDIW